MEQLWKYEINILVKNPSFTFNKIGCGYQLFISTISKQFYIFFLFIFFPFFIFSCSKVFIFTHIFTLYQRCYTYFIFWLFDTVNHGYIFFFLLMEKFNPLLNSARYLDNLDKPITVAVGSTVKIYVKIIEVCRTLWIYCLSNCHNFY